MGEIAKIILAAVLAIVFTVWLLTVVAQLIKNRDDDLPPPPGAVMAVAGLAILAAAGVRA